jgi:DNA-binding transcriptional regulator/RsmH inhibitor MraZ
MSPTKITSNDIQLFTNLALKNVTDFAVPLDENGRILISTDFVAFCKLEAALSVFKKLGIVPNEVELELNKENKCRNI